MNIQEQVKSNMVVAFKSGLTNTCDSLKYILGEFQRLKGTKVGKKYIGDTLTDAQACKVIKGIITKETKLNAILNRETSDLLVLLNSYLPTKVSDDEVKDWINNNVDFSKFRNKMQAVSMIMDHFGVTVDGKTVSNIIKNWE